MILSSGESINKMRERRKMTQEKLGDALTTYAPSMHRLESGKMLPSQKNLKEVLSALDFPYAELKFPYIKGQPMEVYNMMHELPQLVDAGRVEDALVLMDELKMKLSMDNPSNRQFMLSQEAKIMEQQKKPAEQIIPIIMEAISLTFFDFDQINPDGNILLPEETELFFTLSRLYAAKGEYEAATKILKETLGGYGHMPAGLRLRDHKTAKMLLALCKYCKAYGNIKDALEYCEKGSDISTKRSFGKEVPDFLLLKAEMEIEESNRKNCENLLKQAYAGYLMLGEKSKSDGVIDLARNKYIFDFELHGMDKLDIADVLHEPYKIGAIPAHDSIGGLIHELMIDTGRSFRKICQGVCAASTLHKLQNKNSRGHINIIEPLLERLGRDPLQYMNYFLNIEDFTSIELRDEINNLLIHGKTGEAKEKLEVLKKCKRYEPTTKVKTNYQFILESEISLFLYEHSYTHPEVKNMIVRALKLTIPRFDERKIKDYALTVVERCLIGMLASCAMQAKDLQSAENIYAALLYNTKKRITDDYDRARTFATLSFHYSSCLGRLGRRLEALSILQDAWDHNAQYKRLTGTPNLVFNKAYSLMEMGEKEKSLAYFAMAFYGFMMFGNKTNNKYLKSTTDFVKENYKVVFD